MTADVRVGIVSWNTADLLAKALEALPGALGGLDAEIVIVDNASSDNSVEVALGRPGVNLIQNTSNVGYASAMNQALGGTAARALIALNPDTEAPPGSMEKLVTTLDENPSGALVAPVLVDAGGNQQRSVYPYPGPLQAFETGFLPRPWRRDERGVTERSASKAAGPQTRALRGRWVLGAVHCIRRSALGSEPPYSTRWFMYVEDIELCWRLEKNGWENLLRLDVSVVHHGNAAGIQRWGEGASLELRSIPNIYEWLRSEHSLRQAHAAAAVNVAALATKRQILRLGALLAGRRAEEFRRRAKELEELSVYHRSEMRAR